MTRALWFAFLVLLAGCQSCGPGPSSGDRCVNCHEGIEQMHGAVAADECTDCHGGDGTARQMENAHVPIPSNYAEVRGTGLPIAPEGYIRDMAPDQLDALDPDYIRFINPGDIRVVDQTCGTCHPDQVETMPRSVMTTNTNHYAASRFLAGMQDREAIYGSVPASHPECDPSIEGSVCELEVLRPQSDEELDAALEANDLQALEEIATDHYLAKSCNTCHAAGYGKNNSPHLYRSTGCSSCHVLYNKDGVYTGGDPTIDSSSPVHPSQHQITRRIPTEQCATCHFQGGRIGLLFRGIREGGFGDAPPNAVPWEESAYGHTSGYYFLDEDSTNTIDETPPDVHFAAGMHCADCHFGSDVHGDGRIYTTAKQQVDIRCEDCHGTVREVIRPDASGRYHTASGRLMKRVSTNEAGQVVLTGIVDNAEHVIPQPADILASGGSSDMHAAMAPDGNDWSHTDSVTCDTCHTSYNQICIGCHVSYDARLSQVDMQTGQASTGLVRGSRDTYTLDHTLLGQGVDGRVQSVVMSAPLQLAVIDRDGVTRLGVPEVDGNGEETGRDIGVFRQTQTSAANVGFSPFFQHTTTATPRTCTTCHRVDDSPEEWARVRGVYGFGTGEFMLPNPEGPDVDALQFLAPDGTQLTDWVHPGTGPVSQPVRDRALGVEVPQ